MQLGIVMTGAGVHAAASVGVLQALEARGIVPYAACGMQGGAWTAALFAAGLDAEAMEGTLVRAAASGRRLLMRRGMPMRPQDGLMNAGRVERLLAAHLGQTPMSLCPGRAILLGRAMRTGIHVAFSSRACRQESGMMLTMQAALCFAARAALAQPPFLLPVSWMGAQLMPETDLAFACRQALALGAHRVLVILPQLGARTEPDLLDLTASAAGGVASPLPKEACLLRVPAEEGVTALATEKLPACIRSGRRAAEAEMDAVLERMGMAPCRVLPFRGIRA